MSQLIFYPSLADLLDGSEEEEKALLEYLAVD